MTEDFGENYEYLRVIVNNSIELKKIEWTDKMSGLVGSLCHMALIMILGVIAFVTILAGVFLATAEVLNSNLLATLAISVLLFLLIFCLLILKKQITSPIKEYVGRIILENL